MLFYVHLQMRVIAYRFVAAFDFQRQIAFIRFIGTHKEYDKINVKMI